MEDWPAHVYPHRSSRARYIVRALKAELIESSALTRIGRNFVVLGAGYAGWLQGHIKRVAEYEIASKTLKRGA